MIKDMRVIVWLYQKERPKVEKEVREPGLEPGSLRWQRNIVPLDHSRFSNSLPAVVPLKRPRLAHPPTPSMAVEGTWKGKNTANGRDNDKFDSFAIILILQKCRIIYTQKLLYKSDNTKMLALFNSRSTDRHNWCTCRRWSLARRHSWSEFAWNRPYCCDRHCDWGIALLCCPRPSKHRCLPAHHLPPCGSNASCFRTLSPLWTRRDKSCKRIWNQPWSSQ